MNLKFLLFPIIVAILLYMGLAVLVYLFQHRLLHLPFVYSMSRLTDAARDQDLKVWPSTDDYRGLLAAPDRVKGTVLVFHGNAGSAIDRTYYSDPLVKLGYRVILAEYPGYGARSGKLSKADLIGDAQKILQRARSEFGGPVYLFGESLGSGVAAGVIERSRDLVDGALFITPWDNLTDVAQSIYWFLPVKLLIKEEYDSSRRIQGFPGPLAVIMAERDGIIPAWSTERLFHSFRGKKRMWVVSKAGHNDWIQYANDAWWAEIMLYLTGS